MEHVQSKGGMMNGRIKNLREYILDGKHRNCRRTVDWHLAEDFAAAGFTPLERSVRALEHVLAAECPAFIPESRIVFMRTVANLPDLYTAEEMTELRKKYTFCEKGVPFNFTPDYASVLDIGLDAFREKILNTMKECDEDGRAFLAASLRGLDALTALVDRYIAAAAEQGLNDAVGLLKSVRHRAPETFPEAMQLFRILHYALWCEGGYHMGIGRVDVIFRKYYESDIASGRYTAEEEFDFLEEFFLTFNIDSDLYVGVQQGDNGQSLMIGGCDSRGDDIWNLLSEKILEASCELKLIDPKINFRVNSSTPVERLALGSRLTRAGLGFPQYSNDDIMLPALESWGYSPEDARDYSCAACWELIIPGKACEFVNLDAVSIPGVLLECMDSRAADFEEFCTLFRRKLRQKTEAVVAKYSNVSVLPSPFVSALCPVALSCGRNINEAGIYHNWGMHGSGIAVAADSLAALEEMVYRKKMISLAEMKNLLDRDFAGDEEFRTGLREKCSKLGGKDPENAEKMLAMLLQWWAEAWKGLKTPEGGVIRPGTGSAMYYIWHSSGLGATPDGRKAGEPFPANFSPSLDIPLAGPLSVIRSFALPEIAGACNGGPLTIELHDSVFSADDAELKVAHLIAEFIRRGGHQLQLNTVNSTILREAQLHPERYKNLIVRVWGWSGRFVELDKVYQDHIIRRSELSFG